MRPGHRVVAGQIERDRPAERGLGLQRILGDVHQDRPRPAGGGHVERLGDGPGDVVGVGDQEIVLGDRQRDPGDVGFLEPVGPDQPGRHLAGDGHHRDRVHVGVGERRHQVGGSRARRGHAHPRAAGHLGVAGGGVPGALLVPDQDVAHAA